MRFEVPQFIDVEDKIFGPLTLKQFIYLVGGAGLSYVAYKIVPFPISWLLIAGFVGLALALAFYKLNNRPFIEIAQSWLAFQFKGKLYVWKRAPVVRAQPQKIIPPKPKPTIKDITAEQVAALSQNLDILDSGE